MWDGTDGEYTRGAEYVRGANDDGEYVRGEYDGEYVRGAYDGE